MRMGWIFCILNVITPAKLTQTRFIKNNKNAPKANVNSPEPNNNPQVTSGGSNATATITPIRIVLKPTVKANAPAIPEAKAKVMLPRFVFALMQLQEW